MASIFETSYDTVISGNAVVIVHQFKWFDDDCIGFNVVGKHYVVISAAVTDRESARVICIHLADRIDLGVDLVGLYGWEFTGDFGKSLFFWFCGAHSFPSPGNVSFLVLDWYRAVFCGVCKSETWPRREVASVDGREPSRADRKTSTSIYIAY